ncbi:YqaA family protein [Amphritea sp. 1_MG-2023]|uniref:YqaA family protein n=1 Tax=Amphritea sp. 1_MG-2023 TaxID=3062670 RepID=UPI0026E4314C|nr:YqaA family protein [Amphritea sp. 1_MG-2023]MDO6562024.1 YqaA family protein [Amphritea sp. 1_MG-2023]
MITDPALWGLFFSSFIASTLMPGGSEVLLGYLAAQPDAQPMLLLLIASVGNSLGGMVTYWLGVWLSRRWAVAQPRTINQQRALSLLRRFGAVALLFSWLPFIGDPLCLIAGWLRCRWWLSLVFIISGKTLRYLLIVLAIH